LLGGGNRTSLTNGAWNTITIPSVGVTSGTAYWIAVLSTASGAVAFRDANGTCISQSSAQRRLTALPSTWTPGQKWPGLCPLSAYGSSGSGGSGALSANPNSLAFGSVVIGNTSSLGVTLTNTEATAVTISNVGITGAGYSLSAPATPQTLQPNGQTSFT